MAADLSGKTALVTGGGSGIGAALAVDLAAAGVTVMIAGRRAQALAQTAEAISAAGGTAHCVTADMTVEADIERLAAEAIHVMGGVDILVNNAGFSSRVRSARYISGDEWRAVMDVNTFGPAVLTRALLETMIERGSGDVVMVSSMAALQPNVMAGVVYSAAKVAAKGYMEVLSQEVRRYGIRCTTIYPGEVDTPILDNRALPPGEKERALMMLPEDISAAIMMALSLPHRATVSEIAIGATAPRDMSADFKAALTKKTP